MKKTSKHKQNKKELQPLYLYIRQTEKNRRKEYEQFLESASEHLSIPKDVLAGQAIISMTGNHNLRVVNYRGVETYTTEEIKLSLGKKSLLVQGTQLTIEYFRKDEIKIIGNILDISFV